MKQNTVDYKDWLKKKQSIEKEIKRLVADISSLPHGQHEEIQAGEAKARLDSFVYRKGAVREMTENDKLDYETLKQDFENKHKIARETKEKYALAKEKLNQKRTELGSLEPPETDEVFHSSGLEILLKKSLEPWIVMIKEAESKKADLSEKRTNLIHEKSRLNLTSEALDEDSLLKADIDKHHQLKSAENKAIEKAMSIENLIQQIDNAICEKEKHLKALRADFSEALQGIVRQITKAAAKEISTQFEEILKADAFYFETCSRSCNELIKDAGVNPNDIFMSYGAPSLKMSVLRGKSRLVPAMESFIEMCLKS